MLPGSLNAHAPALRRSTLSSFTELLSLAPPDLEVELNSLENTAWSLIRPGAEAIALIDSLLAGNHRSGGGGGGSALQQQQHISAPSVALESIPKPQHSPMRVASESTSVPIANSEGGALSVALDSAPLQSVT